jgi:histidinol-phosphate aminotransferase
MNSTGPRSSLDLLRPAIRQLQAYQPADYVGGLIRLNANEAPWRPPGDTSPDGLNRYPDPRPAELTLRLAKHYGVAADQLLVTRGSSEGIDILIRAFCEAGRDEITICPPTFGMYRVYAQVQGATIRQVPLDRHRGFALDIPRILAGWRATSRLLFLCSPNNPTGNLVPAAAVAELCAALAGRGVVVLDGAYLEFADADASLELLERFENLVVLRTLSKALGLAGVRCGALLGRAPLVELLGRLLPPYCFPTLSQMAVQGCLEPAVQAEMQRRQSIIRDQRPRMAAALAGAAGITRVWPSEANFVFVEAADPGALVARARDAGILIRDFSRDPALPGGIRITVGTPEENQRLLEALGGTPQPAAVNQP